MKHIGPYKLENNLFLAPMVGVSDTPFREICSEQGAGLTVGEMLTCNKDLWGNERNRLKQIKPRIPGPQVVQIAGSDPFLMAEAAQLNEAMGASAIDAFSPASRHGDSADDIHYGTYKKYSHISWYIVPLLLSYELDKADNNNNNTFSIP